MTLIHNAPLLLRGDSLLGALGIGVLCCVLPFLLYTKGLQGVDNGKAAIMATVEPAVACLISFSLLGEPLTAGKISGILLILASVLLLNAQLPPRQNKNIAQIGQERLYK